MKKKSASTDKSKEKRKEKKKTKKLRIQRESVQLKIMKCLSRGKKEEEEGKKNPIRTQICYNNIALKFAAICSFVRMYARFFSLCKMFKSQTD